MLNNLYIFHSTGKLLFYKNWKLEGMASEDPVLISGFLSAIWTFAQKVGSKGVRAIHMDENLLMGISSPTYDLLFVLVVERTADTVACKALLGRIRQSFIQKHRGILKEPDFLFSTDVFDDWANNLENILEEVDVAPVESVMKKLMKNIRDETKEDHNK